MSSKVHLVLWLCLSLLQLTWTRSLSVKLNLSLTRTELADQHRSSPQLSEEMLRSCMNETQLSMAQLKMFRLSLISNDYTSNDNEVGVAMGSEGSESNNMFDFMSATKTQQPLFEVKRNEPLQCFVRCLYDRLGLIKDDMELEDVFRKQMQYIIQRERPDIKECMDLQSKNRCEAAYKLHLCYDQLKNLDAEQRIREVLERSETALKDEDSLGVDENENDTDTDADEVVIDGLSHSGEQ